MIDRSDHNATEKMFDRPDPMQMRSSIHRPGHNATEQMTDRSGHYANEKQQHISADLSRPGRSKSQQISAYEIFSKPGKRKITTHEDHNSWGRDLN